MVRKEEKWNNTVLRKRERKEQGEREGERMEMRERETQRDRGGGDVITLSL